MPSQALQAFLGAIDEIDALGSASHPSLGPNHPGSLRIARAIGRGQIVLLSSHFERYIYALNEELISTLNRHGVHGEKLTETFRLQHSMSPIDELSLTDWLKRGDQLKDFVVSDAWLWTAQSSGNIVPTRLLAWMKAPNPKNLVRYFKLWGIDDVFTSITRKATTRQAFWLSVQGLVDLRNNIAHGDYSAQATQADARRYVKQISEFCKRTDRKISGVFADEFSLPPPW